RLAGDARAAGGRGRIALGRIRRERRHGDPVGAGVLERRKAVATTDELVEAADRSTARRAAGDGHRGTALRRRELGEGDVVAAAALLVGPSAGGADACVGACGRGGERRGGNAVT